MKKLFACVAVLACVAMLVLAIDALRTDEMDVVGACVILCTLLGAPLIVWDARHRAHVKVSGSS